MSFTIGELSQSSCYRRWKEGRPLLRPLLSGERGAFGCQAIGCSARSSLHDRYAFCDVITSFRPM